MFVGFWWAKGISTCVLKNSILSKQACPKEHGVGSLLVTGQSSCCCNWDFSQRLLMLKGTIDYRFQQGFDQVFYHFLTDLQPVL